MDAQVLRSQVQELRGVGHVIIDYKRRAANDFHDGSIYKKVDRYVEALGFRPLDMQWRLIDRQEARYILHKVIAFDLAYGDQLMPDSSADSLINVFLSYFPEATQFVTNVDMNVHDLDNIVRQGHSWIPITQSTFDAGVVCISPNETGLMWVEDED
jgi:hypothetical protein